MVTINSYPDPSNFTGATGLFDYGNQITQYAFMPVMLMVIWVVMFAGMKSASEDTKTAATYSSFIVALLSMILRAVNLVTDSVILIFMALFIGTAFLLIFERR